MVESSLERYAPNLRAMEKAGVLTPTAFSPDQQMTYERYKSVGIMFGRVYRASKWWIGDWINFGEMTLTEKYLQAVAETGLREDTIRNYASVCRRIAPHRRLEGVPFSVHEVVAVLPPGEQKRWLKVAQREGLSVRALRDRIEDEHLRRAQDEDVAPARNNSRPQFSKLPEPLGLPRSYVVPGPLLRRLIGEAVEDGRTGRSLVPTDLLRQLEAVIE